MKIPVVRKWCFAALALAVPLMAGPAAAQEQLDAGRPVRMILPFGVGTSGDVMMRAIAHRLTERTKQNYIVENRDGALGIIATQAVAQAAPDGHTLFFTGINHVTNVGLRDTLPYDTAADFTPVSLVGIVQTVLVADQNGEFDTYEDLLARARSEPGVLTYASAGNGTGGHLSMEMFARANRLDMRHIPYRSATAALNDVVAGRVDVLFTGIAGALPLIQQGRLKPLVVSGKDRSAALPETPSLGDLGLEEYDVQTWFGLLAPHGTPPSIIEDLSGHIAEILREPEIRERFETLSVTPVGSTPEEFGQLLEKDLKRWPALIHELGIKS